MLPGRPPAELAGQPAADGACQQLGLADILAGGVEEPPALGQPSFRLRDGEIKAEQFGGGVAEHVEFGLQVRSEPGVDRGQRPARWLPLRCWRQVSAAATASAASRSRPVPLDLGRRGVAQFAVEQPVELPSDLAAQPRPVLRRRRR